MNKYWNSNLYHYRGNRAAILQYKPVEGGRLGILDPDAERGRSKKGNLLLDTSHMG